MYPIIKVDNVSSFEDALTLEKLGVNIIGFSLNSDIVNTKQITNLKEIRNSLTNANICCHIPVNSKIDKLLFLINECDFIQIDKDCIYNKSTLELLNKLNKNIIFSNINASYEDDPSWILSEFKNMILPSKKYFKLELFTDVYNSWNFLKNESPNYPDELQIKDINNIALNNSLFISLDFSIDNIIEIFDKFPKIYGINFTLSNSEFENIHYQTIENVIKILNYLNDKYNENSVF